MSEKVEKEEEIFYGVDGKPAKKIIYEVRFPGLNAQGRVVKKIRPFNERRRERDLREKRIERSNWLKENPDFKSDKDQNFEPSRT